MIMSGQIDMYTQLGQVEPEPEEPGDVEPEPALELGQTKDNEEKQSSL